MDQPIASDTIASDGLPFSVAEVLDLDSLQPLFDNFAQITGVAAALLDLDGKVLISANWKESCTQFHRQNPITAQRCLESDTALANNLESRGLYNVYRCKNGLVDVATPVVIKGYHIANVFIGQFFFEDPDLAAFRTQARTVGFDEPSYLAAIARVPVFSESDIRLKMEFIVRLAEMIVEFGIQNLHIRQTNEELYLAREKAEVASRAKSTFLSRMSHEVRTPLNAIMGFSQILQAEMVETGQRKGELLNHVIEASDHLLTLVTDILDYVNLDSHVVKIPLSPVALQKVVADSVTLVRPIAHETSVTVTTGEVQFAVLASETRLKQVLVNLISNAVKYNRRGGSVHVSAAASASGMVTIVVEDTGVGIARDEIDRLFQPFSRLSYAEQQQIPGTGIGLSLCKYLVEEMGGAIAVASRQNGDGSRFSVTLASAADVSAPEPAGDPAGEHRHPATGEIIEQVEGGVLYIEDNSTNIKLLELVAARYPALVFISCLSANEGIARAEQLIPDLIILDINLPDMDGLAAVKVLRKMSRLHATRIVALSADAHPAQIDAALQAGFDAYYTKPISLPTIYKLFNSLGSTADLS